MKGLELAQKYFEEVLYGKIKKAFPDLKISAGLIGYGSECYGYDDNLSKDHDFGAMCSIWLTTSDYEKYYDDLSKLINEDESYLSYKLYDESYFAEDRRGVLDINKYIFTYLGSVDGPTKDEDFREIPQYLLSSFTNGKIFVDEIGIITKIREKVKYYPRDIRFNMIATRCMEASREGLYNYERCIKRNEYVAANQALSKFIEAAIELYFLIYERYCPYYKWQHRMLKELDENAYNLFNELVKNDVSYQKKINLIDKIACDIVDKLDEKEIIVKINNYLGYYGPVIQSRIDNENIRNLGSWRD